MFVILSIAMTIQAQNPDYDKLIFNRTRVSSGGDEFYDLEEWDNKET